MKYFLDKFEHSSDIVVKAMLDIAFLKNGESHIDLGSGDGRFLVEASKRGAISKGYEINKQLIDIYCKGLDVINDDCFNADVSQADVVTMFFSLLPGTDFLMDKLFKEMKSGARLVKECNTPHKWESINNIDVPYQKEFYQDKFNIFRVDGQIICLYIK